MLDADAERYVQELARRAREGLGADFVAAYLIGSGAMGGWRPQVSDVDVLVVCARPLARSAAERLVAPLRHRALPCPTRALELVVYRREVLARPGSAVPFEVNLNTGPGIDEHVSFDPADDPAFWFLIDVAIAREHARALDGPPPETLIGAVPRTATLAALRASLDWHAAHEGDAASATLNAYRALRHVMTGAWGSKDEAASWAATQPGERELAERALRARHGSGDPPSPDAVAALRDRVAAEIAAASPGAA